MSFQQLPDGRGKIYIPVMAGVEAKKHACSDCFACLKCADDRCRVCRSCGISKKPRRGFPAQDKK